jgi:hypothetical protein
VKKGSLETVLKAIRLHRRLPAVLVMVGAIWVIVANAFSLYGALYLDLPQFAPEQLEQAAFYGKMEIVFGFLLGSGGILMLKNRGIGGVATLILAILGFVILPISPVGMLLPIIGGILGFVTAKRPISL